MLEAARAIEIRVVHVRDESSRWPYFATLLMVSLATFILGGLLLGRNSPPSLGGASAQESRLRRLTIVDGQGRPRIVLSATDDEGANLVLYGRNDLKPKVVVHSYDDGVDGITVYDPTTGKMRLSVGVGPDGNPMQLMYDDENNRKRVLGVRHHGSPKLQPPEEKRHAFAGIP